MEQLIKVVVPLFVGALIGYITNNIAIKMLFHPRKAYYIGKFQLPFTPGLIPKEKKRIAHSLGRAVSEQLLNSEILRQSLISKDMTDKICASIINLLERNHNNKSTIEDVLQKIMSSEKLEQSLEKVKESVDKLIVTKLSEADIAGKITEKAEKNIRDSIERNLPSFLNQLVNDELLSSISGAIGTAAQSIIIQNAPEILKDVVDEETDKILQMRICDVIEKLDGKLQTYLDTIIAAYVKIVNDNIERLLKAVDLAKMVEERIDSFNVEQLESLIFGIMKKELNAIVYLGALLGFLMGFANILLNILL